jgi:hypothetical protein
MTSSFYSRKNICSYYGGELSVKKELRPHRAHCCFDSIGIASVSPGWPPSTGSIITPEPASALCLALGSLVLLRRRIN